MVLEPISVGLKFGFLVVLYLFLLWVVRSALKDLRRGRGEAREPEHQPVDQGTAMHAAVSGLLPESPASEPRLVVKRAPGHDRGESYVLGDAATLGRGDVEIPLEDPFASNEHARIGRRGDVVVLEDLGSTNGTYLNGSQLSGPQALHSGDRIRIGDSEFSFEA